MRVQREALIAWGTRVCHLPRAVKARVGLIGRYVASPLRNQRLLLVPSLAAATLPGKGDPQELQREFTACSRMARPARAYPSTAAWWASTTPARYRHSGLLMCFGALGLLAIAVPMSTFAQQTGMYEYVEAPCNSEFIAPSCIIRHQWTVVGRSLRVVLKTAGTSSDGEQLWQQDMVDAPLGSILLAYDSRDWKGDATGAVMIRCRAGTECIRLVRTASDRAANDSFTPEYTMYFDLKANAQRVLSQVEATIAGATETHVAEGRGGVSAGEVGCVEYRKNGESGTCDELKAKDDARARAAAAASERDAATARAREADAARLREAEAARAKEAAATRLRATLGADGAAGPPPFAAFAPGARPLSKAADDPDVAISVQGTAGRVPALADLLRSARETVKSATVGTSLVDRVGELLDRAQDVFRPAGGVIGAVVRVPGGDALLNYLHDKSVEALAERIGDPASDAAAKVVSGSMVWNTAFGIYRMQATNIDNVGRAIGAAMGFRLSEQP